MAALHETVERDGHVVAQVVESELGVRPVGDVRGVRLLALRERHHVLDVGDRGAEPLVHRARPLRVALGEIVVHRDEVDALAGERVEVERLGRHEGLALAGLHLGDVALVEDDAAHHLHLEQLDATVAAEGLAHRGERLEEQLLERRAVLEPLLELRRLPLELGIRELLELGLEREDVLGLVADPLEAPALAGAQNFLEGAQSGRHRLLE